MNVEEKLKKCIEFIKGIESGADCSFTVSADDPRINGDFECDECGSHDIIGSTVVTLPADLRDKAWHLLADIDGL